MKCKNEDTILSLEDFIENNSNFYMIFVDSPTGGYRRSKYIDILYLKSNDFKKSLKKRDPVSFPKLLQKYNDRAKAIEKLKKENPELDNWLLKKLSKPYEKKTSLWVVKNLLNNDEVCRKLYEAYLLMRKNVKYDFYLFS